MIKTLDDRIRFNAGIVRNVLVKKGIPFHKFPLFLQMALDPKTMIFGRFEDGTFKFWDSSGNTADVPVVLTSARWQAASCEAYRLAAQTWVSTYEQRLDDVDIYLGLETNPRIRKMLRTKRLLCHLKLLEAEVWADRLDGNQNTLAGKHHQEELKKLSRQWLEYSQLSDILESITPAIRKEFNL